MTRPDARAFLIAKVRVMAENFSLVESARRVLRDNPAEAAEAELPSGPGEAQAELASLAHQTRAEKFAESFR